METEILTINDVAKRMNVSKSWIYRKVKAGIIPHVRIDGMTRFIGEDLEAWINAHRVKGCLKV